MQARNGLMGSFGYGEVIGVPVLRLELLNPSILKTERPPRYPMSISWLAISQQLAPVRAQRSPAGSGFVQW